MENFNKILVLAPQTNDAEFGCGGAISKYIKTGYEVFCVGFSAAEDSSPSNLDKTI